MGEAETCFSSLAVELRMLNAKVRVGGGTVGKGGFGALEGREVGVMSIIAIENDDFGILTEEDGFGVEIGGEVGVGETSWDKIGEGGDGDGQAIEDVVFKRGSGSGDDSVSGFSLPGITKEFVEKSGFDGVVRSENGRGLASGEENLVDIMGNGSFAS